VRILLILAFASGVGMTTPLQALAAESTSTTPPTTPADQVWVRGEVAGVPLPVWGVAGGLQIGLSPLPGPRGLLRVYAPYLKQPVGHVINFIAVEPIPKGADRRGLSELEFSRLDNKPGKRFWSSNTPDADAVTGTPATGVLEAIDGKECLSVYVLVERFDNGAHVYLKLTFAADRPHEVRITTHARKDSAPLDYCIVTATMGNYARLRRLKLADKVAVAGELWPDYRGDGFADHAKFPLSTLTRNSEGHAWAVAETDETDLTAASYAPDTRSHWKYLGDQARQGWKSEQPDPRLEVWVNGRYTYWASQSPIPGGIAFENFEMVSPFRQGEEFIFSVEPRQETE
jgi:hypothetical protein